MSFKRFRSKVLLFGEYSVIYNSQALVIPHDLFSGKLAMPATEAEKRHASYSNQELQSFFYYLHQQCEGFLKLDSLEEDLRDGLYFDSNIPHGFGLGSSGALCAAVYFRYKRAEGERPVSELKKFFALMESYFHGRSSGIDPLISYLERPLLAGAKGDISPVKIGLPGKGQSALFLINSKKSRRTRPLVKLFLDQYQTAEFKTLFEEEITPLTNQCIDLLLGGHYRELWDHFLQLSNYQLQHLKPMIPKSFHPLWKSGLEQESFALKLCGAGGGGFFLGMTNDFQKAKESLRSYETRPVLLFNAAS